MKQTTRLLCWPAALAVGTSCLLADVRQGLVSHWPLDSVAADATTADVISGNHLNLMGLDASAVVPGQRGSALVFDGATQYGYYTATPDVDTGLPISRAGVYSVAFWVKGAAKQTDRRVFSESNSLESNNNPLVNIGTHTSGTDGTVDLFYRNGAGVAQLNHLHSPGTAYDDAWHHVALVDVMGAVTLYLDGNTNLTAKYTRALPAQDTTSLAAIVRANGGNIGAYFAGTIDDVAVWDRALTWDEVKDVMANGVPTSAPAFAPFVTLDPVGASDLMIGDTITLFPGVSGTHPLTYQWLKNDQPIQDASTPTLTLASVTLADSGQYKLKVTNGSGSVTTAPATLLVSDFPAPNLTNKVVAYWPLNEIQGTKTPDIVSGYDMDLVNLKATDVQPGKWGNCFTFDLARQTMLTRIDNAGEALPMYQHPSFSVSLWVNGALQSDKRVFAEGSTKTTQPLFNIGTHNTGADGGVDSYIRTDTGATQGDHRHSTGIAYDSTWHHILYTQREVSGVMKAVLYIDGVADPVTLGPVRPLSANTTTIGGILRATPSAWFTGQIDDVVIWNRTLSPAEAQLLATGPMPTPPANIQPLAINSFKSDLPEVVAGDSVTLRWDVSKQATQILIDNGVGDVTSKTVTGAGSIAVTPTATTTYTLTIKRGTEQLTATRTVTVLDGVAANWAVLDNFDEHSLGPISHTAWWSDLRGDFAMVEDLNGNHLLSIPSVDSAAVLPLNPLKITEGQERTLFFRMRLAGEPAAALRHLVGLTDKNIRSHGDATGNIGPILNVNFDPASPPWYPGVINGVGGAVEYATDPLETGVVYSVWIDIKNVAMNDPISPFDVFSVYIKKAGAAERTELFRDYASDRDPFNPDVVLGPMTPDLNKLIIASNNPTDSAWFDDFFVSKSGYNATEPVPFNTGGTPAVGIGLAGAQVEVSWSGGTLISAPTVAGPWTPVAGATTSPYRTAPTGQVFYRVMR